MEKWCFVDVRKLGQVSVNWATSELWEKLNNIEDTSNKRSIFVHVRGK